MKVPIIILNYNSVADCRKCIGFLKQQEGVNIEIVVVDNCSPRQGEQEDIEQLCREQDCTFIQVNENRGYNAGNNIGLRYAAEKGYKYALIANPDMEFPQMDYLKRMVKTMEQDESIVVCGSDIITPDGLHQNPMREITYCEELFWPITIFRNRKRKEWFLMNYHRTGYCEKLSGCCLMVRIKFVLQIGCLDENVFLYCEEPILAKQIQECAAKSYYLAEAYAVHRHIKSEKGDPKKRMLLLLKSRRYYLKHYSGYSPMKLMLLNISKAVQNLFVSYAVK